MYYSELDKDNFYILLNYFYRYFSIVTSEENLVRIMFKKNCKDQPRYGIKQNGLIRINQSVSISEK
jgi:hypothetical protein